MVIDVKSIIGIDSSLKDVLEKIKKIAPLVVSCLITGETGTGKELIAKLIHQLSPRAQGSFICVNCAAIPAELFESELFGYEKGSFTGANMSKPGLIELAHGGTLFLDEIGELPIQLQPKLLRVLNDNRLRRIGGSKDVFVDFRLVSATNVDIQAAVEERKFRDDLLSRICTVSVKLPPLRSRMEDFEQLVEYLITKVAYEQKINPLPVNAHTMRYLKSLIWEGNIRQLEKTLTSALILANGDEIDIEDVKKSTLDSGRDSCDIFDVKNIMLDNGRDNSYDIAVQNLANQIIARGKNLKELKKDLIQCLISKFNGNIQLTIENTGLSRDQLYRALRSDNIQKNRQKLYLYKRQCVGAE